MNHYTYRAEWSREYDEYVGRCIEMPWLTHWAPSMREAVAGVEAAVDEVLAEREGEGVPEPITERKFSGTFLVRTSPSLHARLAVEAVDQNVSMNHWIVQKLADRPPSGLLDW
ncbi:type II toxin-antitoxin system HicB family antitoxin [Mycolicibacter terrae]|uniref:Type II toxin-antitoxin system HicB family antitoxin n=1 Tax=Mycolicibacter terrae TaxID=1788 RepID=A0ACD2ELE1_9MYCO|nr:type II toxin-antitoxin system HicB family antitoxin [Mycolicibacter terrae]RRR43526.1 type II toxin-antitoxin system HicB family antitoxin [Mycolicibacter terrae]